MAKKASVSTQQCYDEIVAEAQAGNFKPVYFLMGEESYYIDLLADKLVELALEPFERDFNLITLFGADADINQVVDTARGFPMGAQRLVVVVREAQQLGGLDALGTYLEQPQPSTILIMCYKHGTIDRRTKVAGAIEKKAVLFESPRLRYDNQLSGFVISYLRQRGVSAEADAVSMICEHIGFDLNRMAGELDKLLIALAGKTNVITRNIVADNVGISKEYNIFELRDALAVKNVQKVMRIADYFDKNPKANPPQKILPSLSGFFSMLMLAYYSPDKTPAGLSAFTGMAPYFAKMSLIPAMQRYSARKVMQILSAIRRADAKSKGVESGGASAGDIMKELYFFILHD